MASKGLENFKLLVVAIDFGTTFSGYAFAWNDEKREIKMNKNWGDNLSFQSYKSPTCVLVGPAEDLESFGYDAEMDFANLYPKPGETEQHHLFRNFKMALHREIGNRQKIANSKIMSTTGKRMLAVDIFAMVIRYLQEHVHQEIGSKITSGLDDHSIKWVLTVPAIWSDEAKHLMREASKKAGIIDKIDSENLIIALEPEAASIYCRENDYFDSVPLHPGNRYLIIDCGGGTADITAHEVTSENTLREIYPPSGGPWGGTCVDDKFHELLEKLLSKRIMECFKKDYPQAWLSITLSFEMLKKCVKTTSDRGVVVPLPYALHKLVETEGKNLPEVVKANANLGVEWHNGSLYLTTKAALGLFDEVIQNLINAIREIVKDEELLNLDYVFLVGGFSQSDLIQKAIKDLFAVTNKQCKVIVPYEGQTAIVKGAVLFAFQPMKISSRIARASYGFDVSKEFDEKEHDARYIATMAGKQWCAGLFSTVIRKGEILNIGTVKKHKLRTNNESKYDEFTLLHMYRSPEKDVKYITECKKIATLKIEHDFEMYKQNDIEIEVHCGNTEFIFKAKDSKRNIWCQTSVTYY